MGVLEDNFIAKSYYGHPTVSYTDIFYLCFKENNAHITNLVFPIFFVFVCITLLNSVLYGLCLN